ncbi:MAG: alpha/beta fold hydrolase [Actinomycetes bacterium]
MTVTVVLVHGAFTDASSWSAVIGQILDAGVPVQAVANPLRGLSSDAAYVAGLVRAVGGPVLLAGHSYGGAVITEAAPLAANTVGLAYVSGFALDEGESVLGLAGRFPETLVPAALRPHTHLGPGGAETVDLTLDTAVFPAAFAADLPSRTAAILAATQRPIARAALEAECSAVGWRQLPSWYLVAADDRCIHPDAQHFMANRADAHTTRTAGSHAVTLSQPTAVADLVLTAARVLA